MREPPLGLESVRIRRRSFDEILSDANHGCPSSGRLRESDARTATRAAQSSRRHQSTRGRARAFACVDSRARTGRIWRLSASSASDRSWTNQPRSQLATLARLAGRLPHGRRPGRSRTFEREPAHPPLLEATAFRRVPKRDARFQDLYNQGVNRKSSTTRTFQPSPNLDDAL